MRFHLLRCRAFWFGVPGLVFLIWAWWFSTTSWTCAGFGGPTPVEIGSVEGEAYVWWRSDGWPDWRDLYGGLDAMPLDHPSKKHLAQAQMMQPTFRYVVVPHAAVVLLYLLVWAGLLVLRARKHRQAPLPEGEA